MACAGLYIGDDDETFTTGRELSQKVNLDLLDAPLKKVLVYLDPHEFKSTWLGNKAIYRTRMAMADGGELIILAPGLKEFGEDPEIDRLIRKYGYRGTPATLAAVKANPELRQQPQRRRAPDPRFERRPLPHHLLSRARSMSAEAIRSVGFQVGNLEDYPVAGLKDGFNGDVFYISNPALGLWALKSQFSS